MKRLKKGTDSWLVLAPRRSKCRIRKATSSEMAVSMSIFCQLRSPRFCLRSSFLASSKAPTAPKPTRETSATQMPRLPRSHQSRVETTMAPTIRAPPMVGVPALAWWFSGPTSRIGWFILSRVRVRMTTGPKMSESTMAMAAAMAARKVT